MQHWYVCYAGGVVIDIVEAMSKWDAVRQHCRFWSEGTEPDNLNRYNAMTEHEFNMQFCPF